MAVQDRLYTAEDLLNLPHDAMRYELVEGHLIEMSPSGKVHGLITNIIAYLLTGHVLSHKLGRVYGAETGFKLAENPDTVYGIDVAFVSKGRIEPGKEGYFIGAPDLAVEVYSPGNRKTEMQTKIEDCFQAGSRMIWVVYPKSQTIYVYRAENDVRILHKSETLDGGDVIPGFSLKIADIFAVLDE